MTYGLLVTPQINNVSTGVLQEGNKSLAVVTESTCMLFFFSVFWGSGGGGLDSGHKYKLSFSKKKK